MRHYHDYHHRAVDGLVTFLSKSHHDLNLVSFKLEKEFQHVYSDNTNPMKLVSRINKIQQELASIQEQCRELLAAKQDVIDKARATLVLNRSLLQKLQTHAGLPIIDDSNDPEFVNFSQVIEEWTAHVRAGTDNENQESASEDINHLLFSAIVPGN
ncbi:hypothetical protein DM860_015731 [Cuscuta australis]|uniref:Protein FAM33A n=2 Tax=Cuscuta sect. Cleistogrammica TaxID=1824901 RepID=A0A328DQR9_9ASTE|nr:hypothetical protein DM860_015731 [Cuscuta australis]